MFQELGIRSSHLDGNAPEIKKGRKYDQVVAGARDVFMAQGFEGASVDLIAKEAGVSKATLYSYFPDKRILFVEVAKQECNQQANRALQIDQQDVPVREMLTGVATNMMEFLTSPFAQRIFRICVAESDRFPELGREFYQSGPKLMEDRLTQYFEFATARGELSIEDTRMAAMQFQELMKADVFIKMVFNIIEKPDQADIDRVIQSAVDMFLARYGV
jgi:TetR/AcrR family transcriptional repressor of mexJK operon